MKAGDGGNGGRGADGVGGSDAIDGTAWKAHYQRFDWEDWATESNKDFGKPTNGESGEKYETTIDNKTSYIGGVKGCAGEIIFKAKTKEDKAAAITNTIKADDGDHGAIGNDGWAGINLTTYEVSVNGKPYGKTPNPDCAVETYFVAYKQFETLASSSSSFDLMFKHHFGREYNKNKGGTSVGYPDKDCYYIWTFGAWATQNAEYKGGQKDTYIDAENKVAFYYETEGSYYLHDSKYKFDNFKIKVWVMPCPVENSLGNYEVGEFLGAQCYKSDGTKVE